MKNALATFAGPDWEQEDDVTLVTISRQQSEEPKKDSNDLVETRLEPGVPRGRRLAEFTLRSEPGNEHAAMNRVADVVTAFELPNLRLENLKTAVAEATMNAMEHGNQYRADRPVLIRVYASESALTVCITDRGSGRTIPDPQTPDLKAKLAGLQTPRGWGLFLIKNLVDELHVASDDRHHTVELVMHLDGGKHENNQTT